MIFFASVLALQAASATPPEMLDPSTWDSGDLVFVCTEGLEGRSWRTFVIHYAADGREVQFNHQGQPDLLSDVTLVSPVKTVEFNDRPEGKSWVVKGAGIYRKVGYDFRLTVATSESGSLIGSFKVSSGKQVMVGEKCRRWPPRPLFTPYRGSDK